MVPLISESYEKPVITGWSMYSILTLSFQDQGLMTESLELLSRLQGPFSLTADTDVGAPGPP